MNLKPDRERFLQLSRTSPRVPICGEEAVPQLDPAILYRLLFKDSPDSFLFESGGGSEVNTRYSIMGRSNSRCFRIINDVTIFSENGHTQTIRHSPLYCFDRMNFNSDVHAVDYLPHFWGGWVGYIGYEMGAYFEKLPRNSRNDLNVPDLCFLQVDRLVVYDHKTGILKYIISAEITGEPSNHYDRCIEEVVQTWKHIHDHLARVEKEKQNSLPSVAPAREALRSNLTKAEYMSMVEKAKRYIEAGDIYQANLAQRFETNFQGDPFDLYLKLRKINPSPFSGYLKFKDLALVSSSPERLVKVEQDRLETRPIAGTRPRGNTPREDRFLSTQLLLNEKEKAEHLMLVDLERNDLGRVCKYGSVRVTDLMCLEKYSHVTHIVSNIVGQLAPGVSVVDILRAVFPGGTITGCPKIRCMEIIDELEPTCRGPYSGSFGYIGFSAYMDFNIIIRTILIKDRKAYFHVGAGIVADSVPEKEYQETLDKAAAMIQALSLQP